MPPSGLYFWTILSCIFLSSQCFEAPAYTTQVHIIQLNPNMFNWSTAAKRDYHYQPSLVGLPDLPSWLSYLYSPRLESGFLYGVPPSPSITQIEVVALNRDTYETKRKIINISAYKKPVVSKYRVELKIDNLNVEDLFHMQRVEELIRVITRVLWPESTRDLYMTFLASAVKLGARLPLSPDEGEGVVVHLGSAVEFSPRIIELQKEVSPLWKFGSCPRDYRRASVDRHFRQAGFALDWCSFRLNEVDEHGASMESPPAWHSGAGWDLPERSALPVRQYSRDLLATLVSPIAVLLVMVLLLSFILCFQHDALVDESSERFFDSVFYLCETQFRNKECVDDRDLKLDQYEAVQRATSNLRSMSNNRESSQPDKTLKSLPKVEEDTSRPSPPPYGASRKLFSTFES